MARLGRTGAPVPGMGDDGPGDVDADGTLDVIDTAKPAGNGGGPVFFFTDDVDGVAPVVAANDAIDGDVDDEDEDEDDDGDMPDRRDGKGNAAGVAAVDARKDEREPGDVDDDNDPSNGVTD